VVLSKQKRFLCYLDLTSDTTYGQNKVQVLEDREYHRKSATEEALWSEFHPIKLAGGCGGKAE
jgi:hypothetical protein